MPIGMLWIYRLLFVFLFLCPQDFGYVVTDISGVGWPRAMKFCTTVDVVDYQVFFFLVNFVPGVNPPGAKKWKNFCNAYLVDGLRDRAEIL